MFFFFVHVYMEETGQVKNCLGECSLKAIHLDGKCSKLLVSNPAQVTVVGTKRNQRKWQHCIFCNREGTYK